MLNIASYYCLLC